MFILIGITILEICLDVEVSKCFNFFNHSIDFEFISQFLHEIIFKYSKILSNVLIEMLKEDENKRISFKELKIFLEPYSKKIINFVNFTLEESLLQKVDSNHRQNTKQVKILLKFF